MAELVTIDLRHLARGLPVSLRQVETVVELLDEGNTVPFITRYRKDLTEGLDEEQIRQIQSRLRKARLLAERKQTILRSIQSQGKLTEKLASQIRAAGTAKRLEDLYLPFKPKKQTLATLARSRGLEPLADEILNAVVGGPELDTRAADFISPDRQVPTPADALLGAGHILAERFSENAELRQRLREILQRTGRLVSARAGPEPEQAAPETPEKEVDQGPAVARNSLGTTALPISTSPPASAQATQATQIEQGGPASTQAGQEPIDPSGISQGAVGPEGLPANQAELPPAVCGVVGEPPEAAGDAALESNRPHPEPPQEQPSPAGPDLGPSAAPPQQVPQQSTRKTRAELRRDIREAQKKKAEQRKQRAFSDYFDYSEEIRRIPPHRVLAINRGERARVLRVRVECDLEAMGRAADELCVPAGHPHAEFLRGCARDALTRLILPSLEREIRRELTERAETHAVAVFARNLRNLLLQPPVRDRRVLAIDPGYKSGCKLAALDQFGNVLGHGVMYLVGKPDGREEAKRTVIDLVERFQLTLVAIGNGTACRDVEQFISDLLAQELKDKGLCYVIVNEAGASVYSTSRIGREELPQYDASVRGAISIGRRLQDPLSELVKIEPANLGVGLYQHDIKARHLQESLDEVVESCVNYVGVDANTASPGLLRYVSGLNQLTARRLYEYRLEHGPFRNRQQLKEVPGIGEATFVQAAGFLKIVGDNPLDATWIHPESYETASRVLAKLDGTPADLAIKETAAARAERLARIDVAALARELQVGVRLLKDIIAQLARPGRDPREDLPPPIFKRGVLKLEDLTPGMELAGTVLNVVDFGAFVDIGMHDSGLVHISQLADRFVRDPHEVVAVGDIVRVWVLEVDKPRRRVSLTMIPPGHRRAAGHRRLQRGQRTRPGGPEKLGAGPRPEPQARSEGQEAAAPPRRPERPRLAKGPAKGPAAKNVQGPPRSPPQSRPRPRPITPLTEEMKSGKEPMRSFSDLMQFFEIQHQAPARDKPHRSNRKRARPKDRAPDAGQGAQDAAVQSVPPTAPGQPDAQSSPTAAPAAGPSPPLKAPEQPPVQVPLQPAPPQPPPPGPMPDWSGPADSIPHDLSPQPQQPDTADQEHTTHDRLPESPGESD
ncbi:MAG: Tex-like N-terminal domain-containing protein [Thermoguttaceae bacterium]